MKNRWEIKTLRELGDVFNGNSINKNKKKTYFEGLDKGTPYIGTKDVSFDHEIEYESGVKIPDDKRDDFKLAPSNAVLVCAEGGSAGRKIAYTNREIYFGNKLFAICPAFPTNSRFIFYYCLSIDFALAFKNAMAGLIGGVSLNKFKDLSVPIPPPCEQKRIVAILDDVFEKTAKAKENAEKNLRNARELFESYLQSVFANPRDGWEEKKLGEIIKLEYGKPLPNSKRKSDGVYPVYGANGEKDRSNEYYYDKYSIIVGRKGSAGEINLTEERFWPLDVTYFVTFDFKKHDLYFIYYILNHLKLPKLAKGVKPGINRNEVYSIDVHIPPLSEQRDIVVKLNELSAETKKLEAIYQQKLNDLEELKKSILQKAFNGELVGGCL